MDVLQPILRSVPAESSITSISRVGLQQQLLILYLYIHGYRHIMYPVKGGVQKKMLRAVVVDVTNSGM